MRTSASVSIIIPARDEEGTIALIPDLVPKIGEKREIIFVEGHSKDDTWKEIKKLEKLVKSGTKIKAFRQGKSTKGKGNAVEIGFDKASGDILMILDADLSTPPESLEDFYKILVSNQADFVNGSRFVHPKEKGAMKYFNHLGNRFFALVFSLILRQKITDTLCGTKVFWRRDWEKIKEKTKEISKDDPYGDFTLLLGAAKLGLRVKEVPVKYKARIYGQSKISPFFDGIKLIFLLGKDIKNYILSIFS
jgi:glycosyltransferase involved in cell wall biosynthesis